MSCFYPYLPQDDYLDCYGDPAVTGKVGTDIEERKCSWLVVQALNRISDEQMQILKVKKSLYPMICCLSDPLKLVLPDIDAGIAKCI